jgi:polyisoprenoid-binding protein YceI
MRMKKLKNMLKYINAISMTYLILFYHVALTACFALSAPADPSAGAATPTPFAAPENATLYQIVPDQSEARFIIDEILRGEPTTVVGMGTAVTGQIGLDLNDPAAVQLSEITVNARSLFTDNNFRNRAIANEILLTGLFEFITFTPKQFIGLPASAIVGEVYEFQIVGDLTITNQMQEVTFETVVTVVSASKLAGMASAEILYADFGIVIPFAIAVDAVADEVILELEFVATAE